MNYVQVFSINLPSSRKFYTNQASVWWSDNPKHGIWLAIIDNLIYSFSSTFILSEIILSALGLKCPTKSQKKVVGIC